MSKKKPKRISSNIVPGAASIPGPNKPEYHRPFPKWRDLGDYDLSQRRPRTPRTFGSPRSKSKEDRGINGDNFLAVFGRYRSKSNKPTKNFFGLDYNGNRVNANSLIGKWLIYNNGNPNLLQNQFVGGTLPLSDSTTQTWDSINPGPPYRTGGAFFSANRRVPNSFSSGMGVHSNLGKPGVTSDNRREYVGRFLDSGIWGDDSLSNYITSKPSPRVLTSYHTAAWDRLKPHVEKVNAAQFIYELKDLPDMLRTTAKGHSQLWDISNTLAGIDSAAPKDWNRRFKRETRDFMSPKSAADHFLNHNFGWVPFVSDIWKIIQVYWNSRDLIAKSVQENGRWQRRRAVLDNTETHSLVYKIGGSSTIPFTGTNLMTQLCELRDVDGVPSPGVTEVRIRETSRVWAVGSFRFYRPEFDDNLIGFESELMNIQRLLTLYGVRINPTVLWKITPWTWLIDWFVHLGDFISHWDEMVNDGITAKYLYVMQEKRRFATKTCSIFFYSNPVTLSWQRELTTKRREPADSPYGFNRPFSSLSSKQWAILGAIGFSQGGHSRLIRSGI